MKKRIKYLVLLAVLVSTIPSILGVLHSGFFISDDGNWMVVRFSAFYQALREGQFPVRYLFRLNNSFGYPVADFLYPLFMYLAVPVHVLGFNFVNSVKVIFGLSMVFSGIFSYLWLNKRFSKLASYIGSLVYVYFPYHLFDLYKRGSIGEVLGLAIVPFIFWQVERKSLVLTSLGLALLILSHNTIAFLFLPLIIIYMLLNKINVRTVFMSLVFGIGLSTFFWLPALYDSQFTAFASITVSEFSNYFIDFSLLGFISLIILVFGVLVLFFKKEKNYIYFFILFIVFSLLCLSVSTGFWSLIPFKNVIQFPFRLLSVVILAAAYLASFQIDFFKKRRVYLAVIFIVLLFASSINYIYPKSFQYYPDSYYSTNLDTTTVKNEYLPKWVIKNPITLPNKKAEIVEGKAEILSLTDKGNVVNFSLDSVSKSLISVNTIYYPGWTVKVDNKIVSINYQNQAGLIHFNVDSGKHVIEVYFSETPLRLFADIISIIFLALLIFASIAKGRIPIKL